MTNRNPCNGTESMVSYRPVGKQFRTVLVVIVNYADSRSVFFLLQIMKFSVIRIQMFAALCCIFYFTGY